jgi:tetratricopeptide (TPR) repeat protein
MIEWESDLAMDHQISVLATFDTLFDQLERDFPESYNVLRILSFLDPEDIPLAMLTDGARTLDPPPPGNSQRGSSAITSITEQNHDPRPPQHRPSPQPTDLSPELRTLVPFLLSPIAFPKALHKLQSLSLVERLSRDRQSSLRIHDLVHFMAREHVKRCSAYQAWLESTVFLVCSALKHVENPQSPSRWPECEKLMPHVRSLSYVTGGQGVNLELLAADVHLARYLNSRGRYSDAQRLCEHSLAGFRKELGDKHKYTLQAFYCLAQIYFNQGRSTDAEAAFKHVLAVENLKEELGAEHEDTLWPTHELGQVYTFQGRHEEAEKLMKRVLAIREKNLGPNDPNTLMAMHNLAFTYESQKRYDDAEELYKNVLSRREKHFSHDHIETLRTANNLAVVYLSQRKYIDAEELSKRVLAGWENQLGPSHPDTLKAASNLAYLHELQGRNDDAERLYFRALTGMKRHLGADHPSTTSCARAFTAFYRSQGRNGEANVLLDSTQG